MIASTILAMALASMSPVVIQDQRQETPQDVVEDVLVTAPAPEAVQSFVQGFTDPGLRGVNRGQIARWVDPICLRVIGGVSADNTRLTQAVNAVFVSLNIRVDRPSCRPNAMVVIADNADGFAKVFADRYRYRFFPNSRQRVAEFADRPRPVRWEHRTRTGGAGRSALVNQVAGADVSDPAEQISLPNSRITVSTAERIERSMVVLDARRIDIVRLEDLAAYVAFVTLTDLPSGAMATGKPTILGLFDEPSAKGSVGGLTRWDKAFIISLYSVRNDQRFSVQQAEMATRMRRELAEHP